MTGKFAMMLLIMIVTLLTLGCIGKQSTSGNATTVIDNREYHDIEGSTAPTIIQPTMQEAPGISSQQQSSDQAVDISSQDVQTDQNDGSTSE